MKNLKIGQKINKILYLALSIEVLSEHKHASKQGHPGRIRQRVTLEDNEP